MLLSNVSQTQQPMLLDEPDREAFALKTVHLHPLKSATGQAAALMAEPSLVPVDEAFLRDDVFVDDEVRDGFHVPQSFVGQLSWSQSS